MTPVTSFRGATGDSGYFARMKDDQLAAYPTDLRGTANRIIRPAGARPQTSSSSSSSPTAPRQLQASPQDAPKSSPSSLSRRNHEAAVLYNTPFFSSSASSVSSSTNSPSSSLTSSPISPAKYSAPKRRELPKAYASPHTSDDITNSDSRGTPGLAQHTRERGNRFYGHGDISGGGDLADRYRLLNLTAEQDSNSSSHSHSHENGNDNDNDGDDEEEDDEERRIREAAQKEATELVYMHQTKGFPKINPHAPYRNPDLRGRRSANNINEDRKAGSACSSQQQYNMTSSSPTAPCQAGNRINNTYNHQTQTSTVTSTKGESTQASPLSMSSLRAKARSGWRAPGEYNAPVATSGYRKPNPFDIHKNIPSQSKNPEYTSNALPSSPTGSSTTASDRSCATAKQSLEIRSDEIRAATGKTVRSRRLPMPTGVSDSPGRPIVSFDKTWNPGQAKERDDPRDVGVKAQAPSIRIQGSTTDATPDVPKIAIDDAEIDPPVESQAKKTPLINIADGPDDNSASDVHVTKITPDDAPTNSSRSAPTIGEMSRFPKKSFSRPALRPFDEQPSRHNFHHPEEPARASHSDDRWMTSYTRPRIPAATCDACGYGISGRVVTACDARFHSECFTCFHCHTPLECIAFYPEPESTRLARLSPPTNPNNEHHPSSSSSSSQRFYCHIDYHELFSPRCKHCKTPIESEVIIACGADWHAGHFFCAECGDPFTQTTPFVEKDGYAWCVRCHSKRTAPRCLGCKALVMEDGFATALGGAWHAACFNCSECGDNLGIEAGYFVKEGPPNFTAKGRQIGGPRQVAICERCERRRLLE